MAIRAMAGSVVVLGLVACGSIPSERIDASPQPDGPTGQPDGPPGQPDAPLPPDGPPTLPDAPLPPDGPPGTVRLTVTLLGGGTGRVTTQNSEINCTPTCTALFTPGSTVTLTATPETRSEFIRWTNAAGCSTGPVCSLTLNSDQSVTATFEQEPNIVFVTSTTTTANMGGLAGADLICRNRAAAAQLPGVYVAWLSTTTVDAIDRLGNNARGWVRTDGRMFADTRADLAAGIIVAPPRLDEFGNVIASGDWAHTATSVDGRRQGSGTCSDFTTVTDPNGLTAGVPQGGSGMFTVLFTAACAESHHIYCFGVDRVRPLSIPQDSGRYAFVTSASFVPGGGLAAADTLCNAEASTAGLPGSYRALLAPQGATAASRFNTSGAPWVRPDGPRIASTAAAFFSGAAFDVALNVTADGQSHYGNYVRWSGAPNLTTQGTATTTCGNWFNTTGVATSGRAGATDTQYMFGFDPSTPCSANYAKIACLQL